MLIVFCFLHLMIYNEREIRKDLVMEAARRMASAARTAPKAKGVDILETAIVTGDDIQVLSNELRRIGEERQRMGLLRDADNILKADAILLIGTHLQRMGLNCGHCGYKPCEAVPREVPCAFNVMDVGIAIGSACATAADLRMDTRVMYSAGVAAQSLNLLDGCSCVIAIPVSASSKNPFFDRKP